MEKLEKFTHLINRALRYQLKDRCLFVDAKDLEGKRYPEEVPFPHMLDKTKPGHYIVTPLNDAAGIIARYIVEGVDVRLIPEILRSEYKSTLKDDVDKVDFVRQVDKVLGMIGPYIEERTYKRPYDEPNLESKDRIIITHGYRLDFSVNWYPIGGSKRPLG